MSHDSKTAQLDVSNLVDHCADFARVHGVDEMLDALAGIYQAYAPLSEDAVVKIVCEIAGIEDEAVRTVQ